MNLKSEKIRRYDIDWLRNIAVLLLIVFHTMHIFILKPYSVVYIKNSTGCVLFERITQFMHEFHMPLLFLLAGTSVYLSLQNRSISQFLKERVNRLLIPLVFGIVFLIPPMTYLYRLSLGDNYSIFTHYLHFFTKNPGDLSGRTGAFTPAHLWFILYLFLFSLIGAPLFERLNKNNGLITKLSSLLTKRLCLLLYVIPVSGAAATYLLDDKNPLVYFLIFLLGYIIATKEEYQKAINRDKTIYLLLGIIFEVILQAFPNRFPQWSILWIAYETMRQANSLVLVFAILGYGNKYLNRPSVALSYLSRATFPVYILHLPVNTIIGYFIVKWNISLGLKFFLIAYITTTLTFMAYEIILRIRPFRFLIGIKPDKAYRLH